MIQTSSKPPISQGKQSGERTDTVLVKLRDHSSSRENRIRAAAFSAIVLLGVAWFWRPLYLLVKLAIDSDAYSVTIVIPFLSAYFVYLNRKAIFSQIAPPRFHIALGAMAFTACASLVWLNSRLEATLADTYGLTLSILAFAIFVIGSFAFCYGSKAVSTAVFPACLLLLMVPVPQFAIDKLVTALQYWSADGAALLYRALGVPFHRAGLVFDLPGVSIRVAEECSGIRSSLALFVTILMAAQLSLRSASKKLILCILVVPVAALKNSIRIVTLSTLGIYVDPGFLHGHLHRNGGVVFFLLGLVTLIGILQLLMRWERRDQPPAGPSQNGLNVQRVSV